MSRIPTLIIGTRRDWRDPIGWLLSKAAANTSG